MGFKAFMGFKCFNTRNALIKPHLVLGCRKNGEHLGVAFNNVPSVPLLPTIGLHRCAAAP